MRLIDADSLEQKIHAEQESVKSNDDATWERNRRYFKGLAMARRLLLDEPTVEADSIRYEKKADDAPVRHAHWIISCDGYYPYCSACNYWPKRMTKVCKGCGAIMDEEVR